MTNTQQARSVPGSNTWILATDQLPDDDTLVLVATSDGEVWPAYRDGDIWRWGDAMPVAAESVTHWMHLPAAPLRSAA